MTLLATIELKVPATGQGGRVFLDRELLGRTSVEALEKEFGAGFVEPDDEARMALIEQLFSENPAVRVTVHPGENTPPEYHAFLADPRNPDVPLFACVLVPMPVVSKLVSTAPHVVFESLTLQAMAADTEPRRMVVALEAWARRVWPGMRLPRFELSPWPVGEVSATALANLPAVSNVVPLGAPPTLNVSDYPTLEELSA